MASVLKNLSTYDKSIVPSAKAMKFAIVVSEWNEAVTEALYLGAYNTLIEHGALADNIIKVYVPGSFELTSGGKMVADNTDVDAVICLGCIIRGGTPHFEYVSSGVTQGITQLNLDYKIPFLFGVLTTDDQQQALDRAGGVHGNKGDEAAYTAIKMVAINKILQDK